MKQKQIMALILGILVSVTIFIPTAVSINNNIRAELIYPRMGASIRTSPTEGSQSAKEWLEKPISIWISTDPAMGLLPNQWNKKSLWMIGLEASVISNMSLVICDVIEISQGRMDAIMDRSLALEIIVKIPGTIEPGLYNLHVAFKHNLTEVRAPIYPGSFLGVKGSGNAHTEGFYLSERVCVYVPWINDPEPNEQNPLNAFSFITMNDIHIAFSSIEETIPSNFAHLNQLREELSIWAPEVIIISGDLTNAPKNFPNEYMFGYEFYSSLGIPILTNNGNHDQGNLGLFPYYFSPLQSITDWSTVRFINFNSALQIDQKSTNWIINGIKIATNNRQAVFLASHIPLMDVFARDVSGSAAAIMDAMIMYNGTGLLHGHNHYNLVMDAEKARSAYLTYGNMEKACEIPSPQNPSVSEITKPKLIITTSGAKGARDKLTDFWTNYQAYEGYRRITIQNNRMMNYTYDLDGDGFRDPSYSQPLFQLNRTINYDSLIGIDPNAGVTYTIINNLTESIPSARVMVTVPKAPFGYQWNATGVNNILLRSQIANLTHVTLEYRVPIAAKTTQTIHIKPILISGGN
jgi:hypothetical protein